MIISNGDYERDNDDGAVTFMQISNKSLYCIYVISLYNVYLLHEDDDDDDDY